MIYKEITDNNITELKIDINDHNQYRVFAIIKEGSDCGISTGAIIGAVALGVGALIATPFVLKSVGFTNKGVRNKSTASKMMSDYCKSHEGQTDKGSTVSKLQKTGAKGLDTKGAFFVGLAGAAIGALLGGAGGYAKSKMNESE